MFTLVAIAHSAIAATNAGPLAARLRDVAANVPYDALVIMVNHERYGGGGIYGLYCSFTARSPWADYLLLHELGHSFAGLADEYYSSEVAYNEFYPRGREPEEPNITALLDPGGLKLVYSTFLGGSLRDEALGVCLGPDGSVCVVGTTPSLDFPVKGPYQGALSGEYDAFIFKLKPAADGR